jgi:hypothetical protein
MENLQLRILIKHAEGATIGYIYKKEALNLLNIPKEEYDNSQFLETGTKLEYDGNSYEVDSVNLKIYDKLQEMNHGKGISLDAIGDQSDYNCQLVVFVRDAN